MLTIRCTRKLLRRLKRSPSAAPPPSSTVLGDWYAHLVFYGRRQIVLFASERTLLPVLVEGNHVDGLLELFAGGLREVLKSLQVPRNLIEKELREMTEIEFGATKNRSVVGTMVEFAFMAGYPLAEETKSLPEIALWLSEVPCSAIAHAYPCDKVREAFGLQPIRTKARPPLRLVT